MTRQQGEKLGSDRGWEVVVLTMRRVALSEEEKGRGARRRWGRELCLRGVGTVGGG